MSRLDDWGDPMNTFVLLGIIFGFVSLVVLASTVPLVAAMVVFGLAFLAFLAWASVRNGTLDDETEATRERDPLAVLKERYARGEISEEEFEHQVTTLLDVDEIAGSNRKDELVTERN